VEYHSDRFDLGKDGLAAKVFQSGRLKLDLSVNGALPVSSKKNDLRTGMDDLELMIEFGPELEITLGIWENSTLRLDIPVRANFEVTADESPNAVGWSADPRIHFEQNFEHWDWEIDFGALWASESYQEVFYTVADKDVTATRSAYQAQSGVLGWRLSATVERRIGDWILFGYLRQMDLSSAANEDSPLLGQNSYLAGGVAAIWMFKTN
jgi:outer membrane scaffolding protein for murein synthesis (MipA/OmpV family)